MIIGVDDDGGGGLVHIGLIIQWEARLATLMKNA